MERSVHRNGRKHADIPGQERVQTVGKIVAWKRCEITVGILPKCVDTGIGATGTGDTDFFARNNGQFFLNYALNGERATLRLELPAVVIGPKIAEQKAYAHYCPLSRVSISVSLAVTAGFV